MSDGKHTPGPWKVFNGTDIFPDDSDTEATRHIADCSMTGSQFISGDEKRANARLIAAAPDLLAAAKAYIAQIDAILLPDDAVTSLLRTAIAKAETRS